MIPTTWGDQLRRHPQTVARRHPAQLPTPSGYDGASSPSRARSASTRTITRRWSTSRGSACHVRRENREIIKAAFKFSSVRYPSRRDYLINAPAVFQIARRGAEVGRPDHGEEDPGARQGLRGEIQGAFPGVDVPSRLAGKPTPTTARSAPRLWCAHARSGRVHCVLSGAPSRARRCRATSVVCVCDAQYQKILRRRQDHDRGSCILHGDRDLLANSLP